MNNTLVKGLQLLEQMARSQRALGVTELASRLELGKSNVHRLLQALVEMGYAQRNSSDGTYLATLKLWELGNALEARLTIKAAALDAMEQLLQETRETVHLSVLDGDDAMFILMLDSPEPVRAHLDIGERRPAYCVAAGKAILAWQDDSYVERMSRRLKPHTDKTITKPVPFLRELERIRSVGYAVNRGEWRASVWGIASPILNGQGQAMASIGISGPSVRIKPALVKRLGSEVMAAAHAVSARLACSG